MDINKIIIATESQHSWTPDKSFEFTSQQIDELKQYLPTPRQSVELLHSISLAAANLGIDVEHIVIEDIEIAIEKIRLSASDKTCVWVVSDGRIFHNSSPLCAWLRTVNIKVFGIDTTLQSLTDNKYLMTVIAERHGLLVPESMLYKGSKKLAEVAGFNSHGGYFIKPNTLGSQIGISSSSHVSKLEQAIKISEDINNKYGVDTLIQAYINGEDYRVPVIETANGDVDFSCCAVTISNKFNQLQAFSTNRTESDRKWHLEQITDKTTPVYRATKEVVQKLHSLGLINSYSGIDIRGSEETGFFFIENNVKPFIDQSFEALAKHLNYKSAGEMFVDAMINRYKPQSRLFL
ncbi:ATP-grasp domain-containing protein [Pseudoalteromonas sp. SMS1]|uniref:ATP-grasp domain-containing protein n=1 Tax=Pseudoalteromonas sp. SMS1 TaxID=2908894 RepID=UPI001F1EF1E8|nr:ATP-grasp domain-containing protein [Pseudoalteromonas sp. SMS1]MCF2860500.1 ATP-grasp domain-containing protein [Pseudoalteromonas sp. SMS1]